jgi:hypothetical protein
LNTGRLSEGYRDPGLEPKVTRARTTERARDEQISRMASLRRAGNGTTEGAARDSVRCKTGA